MTLDDVVAKVTDPYERQARLYPALLALLPLLALVMLLFGPKATALSSGLAVAISCGSLYLTTNLCRELGKRLEAALRCLSEHVRALVRRHPGCPIQAASSAIFFATS